jgi:hypothetical protein
MAWQWAVFFVLYAAVAFLYRKYFKGWFLALAKDWKQVQNLCAVGGFLLAFPVLFYLGWKDVDPSASSTAAIGYIYVPIFAAVQALFFAAIAFALGACVRAWRSRDRKHVWIAVCAMALSALGLAYWAAETVQDESLTVTVKAIRQMDDAGLNVFLDSHEHKSNLFALGAVAMNPLASGATLGRIASLRDSALHEKYGGTRELMGQNRKGLAVMRLVVAHANVEPATLERLAASRDGYVQSDVAGHRKTPLGTIERLYRESRNTQGARLIDWGLANNAAVPARILGELAKQSRNQYVLRSVANNPSASDDARQLAANRVSSGDYDVN